jgi:predicted glycosyltransferase
MGTSAVSFYPEELLAVDQKMVDDKWMLHSRDPGEIVEYVLSHKKRSPDFSRSKTVQSKVFKIFGEIMDEIENKSGAR